MGTFLKRMGEKRKRRKTNKNNEKRKMNNFFKMKNGKMEK